MIHGLVVLVAGVDGMKQCETYAQQIHLSAPLEHLQ